MRVLPVASLRILGLDPGSRRTGFGVIDCQGPDNVHFTHGCISTSGATLPERLRVIFEGVRELVSLHRPQEVAVEQVFVNRNADSALKLGQARGAVLSALPQGLPIFEYAPRTIKLAVVGFGGAEKHQVAHMIRSLLRLEGRIAADASDALAIAVCHAHSRRLRELVR
jgi:crossover junction endodeoxyribonuclease RuvC